MLLSRCLINTSVPVICNQGPPDLGEGGGNELGFLLLHCPHSVGGIQGIRYIPRQTWQCRLRKKNCHGFTSLLSPQFQGVIAGNLRQKIKVLAIPHGWGGGGVVTHNWYIAESKINCVLVYIKMKSS